MTSGGAQPIRAGGEGRECESMNEKCGAASPVRLRARARAAAWPGRAARCSSAPIRRLRECKCCGDRAGGWRGACACVCVCTGCLETRCLPGSPSLFPFPFPGGLHLPSPVASEADGGGGGGMACPSAMELKIKFESAIQRIILIARSSTSF